MDFVAEPVHIQPMNPAILELRNGPRKEEEEGDADDGPG
jgi:hypothetical protein